MKSCFNSFHAEVDLYRLLITIANYLDPLGQSFQGYSWIQDFEADFP